MVGYRLQPPLAVNLNGCYSYRMETEAFGARVRRIRESKELSLREVARRMGKRSHVSLLQLELGQRWAGRLPPLDELRALAKALEFNKVDDLVGPEMPPDAPITFGVADEPLAVVLHRIGAYPDDDEGPTPLDQGVAAGRKGKGIIQDGGEGAPRRRRRKAPLGRYLVRIEGDCLEPRASDGDLAVFNPEEPAEIGNLIIVAHGEYALVKYLDQQGSVQWLLPIVGEPIRLEPGMRIVGVVKEIRRGPGAPPRMQQVPTDYGPPS